MNQYRIFLEIFGYWPGRKDGNVGDLKDTCPLVWHFNEGYGIVRTIL
jgi:hypothetical protein